jgi:nucleoside-diphosphate-sugar epimerase
VKTVIVGRDSLLSCHLHALLPDSELLSARRLAQEEDVTSLLPSEPFALVLNQFQPANALADVRWPVKYVELAVVVTARLLEAAGKSECVKVVYTSSASVYGDSVTCREGDGLRPSSLHAALKLANEYLVRDACAVAGVDCTTVRLFNLYGGGGSFSVVDRIVEAVRTKQRLTVSNSGNAIRDFIHVGDAARTYEEILLARDLPVVNVATGEGTSVRNILDAVRLRGVQLQVSSVDRDEIRVSVADTVLLRNLMDIDLFTHVVDHVLAELG